MSFDVASLLDDRSVSVVVCCGTGGVGKTSVAAALAVAAADRGRKVVLLTVDPAKRLATALGLRELGADPEPVAGIDPVHGGSLEALMLDMTRTFDEGLALHAPADVVDEVRRNPFYRALSTSLSGTQDYMATEKVGQLYDELTARGRWDLIVVDTPPSRSALDFLASPERLDALADGPLMQVLAPRGPMKMLSLPLRQVTSVIATVVGGQALRDLQVFAGAFEKVVSGFRERAARVRSVLASPATGFVVVATPRRLPLVEAAYFADQLRTRFATRARGLVVNRVAPYVELDAADQARLGEVPGLSAWWNRTASVRRSQEHAVSTYAPAELPVRRVPDLAGEVSDLESVRLLGSAILVGTPEQDDVPARDV